jgi:hypothetical protein
LGSGDVVGAEYLGDSLSEFFGLEPAELVGDDGVVLVSA